MLKDKKILFVSRLKSSVVSYVYNEHKTKHIDKNYYKEYIKQKSIQSGWIDAVKNKELISKLSYSINFLAYIIPYSWFLFFLKVGNKLKIIKYLDYVFLNIDILYKMIFKKCDVLFYYDQGIFWITEKALITLGKTVIEYDGRPHNTRNLKKEITPKGKILSSNMDWQDRIGRNKKDFKIIKLGINHKITQNFDLNNKYLDFFIAGGIDDKIWSKRGEYFEYLTKKTRKDFKIKFAGDNKEDAKYPLLKSLNINNIYGDDFYYHLASAKASIVIISDEHLKSNQGMPMRFYENALFEVFQLVYKTSAYKNTVMEDNNDFVSFATKEEMLEKAKYFLKNDDERLKIVKSAKIKTLENYTAQKCFLDFIKEI